MKKYVLTAAAIFGLSFGALADTLAVWDFNSNPNDGLTATGTLISTNGAATASLVGIAGDPLFNDAAQGTLGISSDPATSDDSAWRIINFPAQGTNNLTAGAEFRVNTTGFENITLSWDQSSAGASSKYYRVLYSVDNGVTFVPKDVVTNPSINATWNNPVTNISFVSIPAANNNTNFIVRILSEFQNTATGSGTVGYATVSGTAYSTTAAFRLDMVTFSGSPGSGEVNILTNPAPSQVVAIGQPASFSVVAGGGSTAIGYQWRIGGTAIPGATSPTYSIASAQLSDAGNYTVVVTNSINSVTSSVAVLTVRTPLNLAWTGLSGATWDSATVSWVNTNTLADVAYTGGDHVTFGTQGIFSSTVSLAETLFPSSITVDADFDYLLRTDTDGKLSGSTGIRKRGTGTLQLDTDNTHTGATVIEAGTLQVGVANARGSLGTGPVTNNSALVFNRSDTNTIANNITGSGTITNIGKGIILTGTNVYNGDISVLSGSLILSGNQTINSSNVRVDAQLPGVSAPTIFGISGGITTSPTTVMTTYGSSLLGDFRVTFKSTSGTNVWNGPIFLSGVTNEGGNNQFQVDNVGTDLTINGDVTGIDGFGGPGAVTLRGVGTGTMGGKITIPGVVNKTDAGTWTIKSTGNSWGLTTIGVGTLKLGINDALPTNLTILMGQTGVAVAVLDLAGFNQQISVIQDNTGGTTRVTNSSTVSDSTLTLTGASGLFSGVIANGATRKTGLTISGGTLTLGGNNTYSGETVINGTLTLTGNGQIPNSTVISVGAGSTLDVTTRADSALFLASGQKLKGDGAFNILGNLASDATIELKINKSGATLTSDSIQGVSQLTYGGTLNLLLSGDPLTAGDNIKLFTATSYLGAFTTINPATPGAGLLWDTSTLTTDGTLRVAGSGAPSVTATFKSGSNVVFSGTGGTANATYYVLSSTNIAAPVATWTPVQTNQFDANGNFSVTNAIAPNVPQNFYLLQVP